MTDGLLAWILGNAALANAQVRMRAVFIVDAGGYIPYAVHQWRVIVIL